MTIMEPLLLFPDPPPPDVAQALDLGCYPWKAVANADAAVRLEPDDGWAGASVSADVDPEAAFALLLAAGLRGIEKGYELPPEATNNIYEMTPEERMAEGIDSLPNSLFEALEVMERSALVAEVLGEHVFDYFIRNKRLEWADYKAYVTPFEINRYLGVL